MTIAVLGPGGVGGFVAGALARPRDHDHDHDHDPNDVVVIAREPTARAITADGIDVRSVTLGDFVAWPRAVASLRDRVDVLIVATKATTLRAALRRVEGPSPALVVPLLNGLDHLPLLRERFPDAGVVAGTIRIESDRPAPRRIVQTSPSVRVELASRDPTLEPSLSWLAATLRAAGIPAEIGPSEAQVMWSKLVRLNALACTTSAADRPIGAIRGDPEWRAALVDCIEETAAVANADGAEIDPAARLAELDDAHPELGSSMQRDIAGGREPELDAIPGAVLRAAARHGLTCPTIARLVALIEQRIAQRAASAGR